MSKGFTSTGLIAAMLVLAGCTSYRPEPLMPAVELRTLQNRTPATGLPGPTGTTEPAKRSTGVVGDYHPEDGLNEAELVMAALSFNPALRDKRYEVSRLGGFNLLGMLRFKPEMRVDLDRATVGLGTDTDTLYTLLIPSLRQAWQDDEAARREASRAEMLAAEAKVVVDVRRSHVRVLVGEQRLAWMKERVAHRRGLLDRLVQDPRATPLDRVTAALAWERALSDEREEAGRLADARRDLNRILGFDPSADLVLSELARPLAGQQSEPLEASDLDRYLLGGRWELRALEAAYRRAEYKYSQAVMEQYPRLKLAPAVTYDREDGTSLKVGASVRLPWPEDARQRIEDEATNRDRARAIYLERLHDLRAEAHGANAKLIRAKQEMEALEQGRVAGGMARNEGAARHMAGEIDLSRYLLLAEQCEELERHWFRVVEEYRFAAIDLDHATGRLNRIQKATSVP
jgi:hypothetical protein